jgi:large subunit ribosomal protein L25
VGEHDRDGILEHVHNSIEVRVDASSIPNFLELDIQGLASGTSKYAADVKLPAGVELESDPKMIVVHLSEKSTAAAEETAAPAADAPAATPAAE